MSLVLSKFLPYLEYVKKRRKPLFFSSLSKNKNYFIFLNSFSQMRKFVFYTILISVLFGIFTFKISIGQNYYHRVFTVQDGLSQSSIFSLCQDKNGNLWIGTVGGGINIYNGVSFKTISKDNGLAGSIVYSIFEDKQGNIWVGTDKGLSRIKGHRITNYFTEQGLPDNWIWKIYQDNKGTIWVGTNNGLASFNGKKFEPFIKNSELLKSSVISLFEDNLLQLWVGTKNNGVFLLGKNSIKQYTTKDGLGYNQVWTINQDSLGRYLFGTGKGITVMGKDTTFTILNNSFVTSYKSKLSNRIYFCTYKECLLGISNANPYNTKFEPNIQLQGYSFRCVIEDREGNLWLGSESGLVQIPPFPFQNWNNNQGMVNKNIYSITGGNSENEFWIGASTGCGYYFNVRDYQKKYFYPTETFRVNSLQEKKLKQKDLLKAAKKGIIGSVVQTITKDNKGRTWFGTNYGISIFNPSDSSYIHITNDSADIKYGCNVNSDLPNKYINYLYSDKEGNIWAATLAGLAKFTDTGIINFNKVFPELKDAFITHIFQDKEKKVWLSTREGLFIYTDNKLTHYTEDNGFINSQVNTVLQDKMGFHWIATKEGLFRYNGKTFDKIDKSKGLSSDYLFLIQQDGLGNLLIGSNVGLDKFDLTEYNKSGKVNIRYYGKMEGFMGMECNRNATYTDSLGRIWFGTIDGVTIYDPKLDKLNKVKPSTTVTNILYNFKDFDWKPYCDSIDSTSGLPVNLVLPYNKNHLTFQFAANCLTIPEKVKYRFMMEGIDTTWSPALSKNEADFPTLPPGKYTFKIIACNNDGVWNEIPTTFSFQILPPWWLTWWAISIAILIGIIIIIAFIKYREAALRKDKIRLEKTVTERTAEVVHQKEIVEQKNKDITDSINYAKNIQEALLPTRNEIRKHFPESFMLYKPRDIVSGDFYWISHRENKTYYAVADCTGHGVPGAFMSMLGIAFMDEIMGLNKQMSSDEILNMLRQNVILSLRQMEKESESKDGMDITLVIVDWDKKEIEYSGANNPLYLVRNNYLIEYKADKMPIGVHIKKDPFSIQRIPFSLGDSIYMFSDGYADQFGGPDGKKFKYKTLKELIVKISNKPMSEQGIILNTTIEEWKGEMPQLDDIIISGIHFGKETMGI